jgi:hypothetical protein
MNQQSRTSLWEWDLSPSPPRPLATIWCRATTQSTDDASAAKGIPGAHHTSAPIPPLTNPPPPPRSLRLSLPLLLRRWRRPCQSADDRTAAAAADPGAYACDAAADVHPSPRSAAEANPFRLPSSAGGEEDEPPAVPRARRRRRRSAAGERSPAMATGSASALGLRRPGPERQAGGGGRAGAVMARVAVRNRRAQATGAGLGSHSRLRAVVCRVGWERQREVGAWGSGRRGKFLSGIRWI